MYHMPLTLKFLNQAIQGSDAKFEDGNTGAL